LQQIGIGGVGAETKDFTGYMVQSGLEIGGKNAGQARDQIKETPSDTGGPEMCFHQKGMKEGRKGLLGIAREGDRKGEAEQKRHERRKSEGWREKQQERGRGSANPQKNLGSSALSVGEKKFQGRENARMLLQAIPSLAPQR